jgi:exosortase A
MASKTDDPKAVAPPSTGERTLPRWAPALAVLAASLALLLGLYRETAFSLVDIWWRSETFAHGFVIVPISLYMVWTRRQELAGLTPRPSLWGVVPVVSAAALWAVARIADVLVVEQLAFVALVPALVVTTLGLRVAWAIAFPLAYLVFAVPMGEDLEPPLMDFTADFTVWALQLSGIPVYVEGRFLALPTGNWEVAQACSGVRYLIASVALGTLYAYLTYRSPWRRLAFIALAVVVPILANGVRAFGIVLLGHLSEMRLAVGIDHIIYGWVFFGLVMLLLFSVGSLWRDRDFAGEAAAAARGPPTPAAPMPVLALLLGAVPAGLALVAGPAVAAGWLERPVDRSGYSVTLPAARGGWAGPLPDPEPWSPGFAGASDTVHGLYRMGGGAVRGYLVHYRHERQGAELINSQNRLYGGDLWQLMTETRGVPEGVERAVLQSQVRGPGRYRLVWSWYDIAGESTADPRVGKLLTVWSRLAHRPQGNSLLALVAEFDHRPEEAEALLRQFLADHPGWPAIGTRGAAFGPDHPVAGR